MREGEKRGNAERKRKEQRRRRGSGEKETREAASTGEPDVVNVAGPVQWSGAQKKRRGAPRRRRRIKQRSVEVSSKVSSHAAECNMSARL